MNDIHRFLKMLSSDEEAAHLEYARIRNKLDNFFRLKGLSSPDSAADETLDRAIKKIDLQTSSISEIYNYIFKTAQYIFLEWRRRQLLTEDAEEIYYQEIIENAAQKVTNLKNGGKPATKYTKMNSCFSCLSEEEQELIKAYFEEGLPSERTLRRQELADKWGLAYSSLRKKILRIRQNLESCVKSLKDKGLS